MELITFLQKSHFDCLPNDTEAMYLIGLPLTYVEGGTFKDLPLKQLTMQFCDLTKIPDLEGVGKTLEVLSMSYNKIKSISARDFIFCHVLHTLELPWNQLSIFPNLQPVMNTLKYAIFANNLIESFAETIYMPAMRDLVMGDNALEDLDVNRLFQMFPNMHTLDVSENKIRNIKDFGQNLCDRLGGDDYFVLVSVSNEKLHIHTYIT